MTRALFIAFEGNEGSGKTTQSDLLVAHLHHAGHDAIKVHEPGSTPLGDHLRTYLKEKHPIHHISELLLFSAARAELTTAIILPALEQGTHVVADRYLASTVAYQGHGRGIDLDTVHALNHIAAAGLQPDLTFWLDLYPALGIARADADQLDPHNHDRRPQSRRFEDQPLDFHHRVRAGYASQATKKGWHRLDATLPVEHLAKAVNRITATALNAR